MARENAEGHWGATSRLMWIALAIWALFSFVIHFFVNSLNSIVIFGFPVAYAIARMQGSLAMVLLATIVLSSFVSVVGRPNPASRNHSRRSG